MLKLQRRLSDKVVVVVMSAKCVGAVVDDYAASVSPDTRDLTVLPSVRRHVHFSRLEFKPSTSPVSCAVIEGGFSYGGFMM